MTTLKRYTGTAWETVGLPFNVAMSPQTLGYAEVTANQGSIAAQTDLTGLTVTITVPEGRRIRITGKIGAQNTSGSVLNALYITEGATILQKGFLITGAVSTSETLMVNVVLTPTAGTHTYKLQGDRASGTMTMAASSVEPAFILVEDITGSTLPYQPTSVPIGILAQTKVIVDSGAMADLAIVPSMSVNVVVPTTGRTLKVSCHAQIHTTAASGWITYLRMDGTSVGRMTTYTSDAAEYQTLDGFLIVSPAAGSHTFDLQVDLFSGSGTTDWNYDATFPGYLIVEDITPTPAPANTAPSSTLGYAEVTANQTGITTEVDLTGLAATVTVSAGRRLRISADCGFSRSVNDGLTRINIKEGATILQIVDRDMNIAGSGVPRLSASVIVTPSAGSHTYKLSMERITGTGNTQTQAGATYPAFILVEDITANSTITDVGKENVLPFGIAGTLVAGNGTARWYFPFAATILGVTASVGTAPTGASIKLDVNKNGTTIFTTQANRPTIAISAFYSGETVPDVTSVAGGDYLTVDRDQVGSTIAGADANLVIRYRRS